MNDITPKEAIANLNHLYGMVSPDIQRSLDVAIKAIEGTQGEWKTVKGWVCDKCNYKQSWGRFKYCPNCGADMRGDTE